VLVLGDTCVALRQWSVTDSEKELQSYMYLVSFVFIGPPFVFMWDLNVRWGWRRQSSKIDTSFSFWKKTHSLRLYV
jgi:hypothetical protein